jgi:tRNA (guanine-N(7)-)-methyltransferase subunit TRM82
MPKRVCAIVLTPDQSMLLVGDKFGDVYSLPLLVSTEVPASTAAPATETPTPKFQTSASELTVHTKGNREALRQQREQKALPKKKEGLTFEHKLLLGHVSLLTDLVITEVTVEGKKRQYILTADRDEHIRVSRGPSQAYVIENYCLGHKKFVSKLCIFPWDTNLLVAGSGETSLKVFHWRTGRLVDEMSFHDHFFHLGPEFPMAVSGLWSMAIPSQFGIDSTPTYPGLVIVAFEARPELLCYRVTHEGSLSMWQIINARMNVLDLAVLGDPDPGKWTMLVSLDRVHVPGSGKQFRTSSSSWELDIESFDWQPGRPPGPRRGLSGGSKSEEEKENWSGWWASDRDVRDDSTLRYIEPKTNETVRDGVTKRLPETTRKMQCRQIVDIAQKPPERALYSELGEFLYGLENLRKSTRDEAGEAGDEPNGGEAAAGGAE